MDLERLQRVRVECRDEDDHRAVVGFERLQDREPVGLRHLHVEEHEIRRERLDLGHRRRAVPALPDDLDVGLVAEEGPQPAPRERFVVDEERADRRRHAVPSAATRHGSSSVTSTPPSA